MIQELPEKKKRIEEIKQKLSILDEKVEQVDLDGVKEEIVAGFLQQFNETLFESMKDAQKKLLVNTIIKEIIIHNKSKVHLTLTLPVAHMDKFGIFSQFGVANGT